MSQESNHTNANNKSSFIKATLIGIAVGVAFMLTAMFVNYAMG